MTHGTMAGIANHLEADTDLCIPCAHRAVVASLDNERMRPVPPPPRPRVDPAELVDAVVPLHVIWDAS